MNRSARMPARHPHRRAAASALAAGSLVVAAALAGAGPAEAAPPPLSRSSDATPAGTAPDSAAAEEKDASYDSRLDDPGSKKALAARSDRQSARPSPALAALRADLGAQAVVDVDPLTGTPRQLARLDGFLTAPSSRPAARVALDYVRSNATALGLSTADLSTLTLRKDYVDIAGTHHLSWVQRAGDVTVFGSGLKANVTKDGRLVNVQGSPVRSAPDLSTAKATVTAATARAKAAADVDGTLSPATASTAPDGSTTFSDGDRVTPVGFPTVAGVRLGWQTITTPGRGSMFLHVVDAATGRVLYRRDLVQSDGRDALVHENYPGAAKGGTARAVDLSTNNWLPAKATKLDGRFARVYTDVNDDNRPSPTEEVTPVGGELRFPLKSFNTAVGGNCAKSFVCTWNPKVAGSWQANRAQNAVQVFYFVSKFHDHLLSAPIGFTRAAGNFDARDGDAVQAQPLDGADTAGGLPDSNHVDNANMGTPPDGIPPAMQMYLFHDPADPADPFLQVNGGDAADIIYHEYTHGLSNRLVVDPSGISTLGSFQAGSMGEAWSDFYALDYLAAKGFEKDTGAAGELLIGRYVGKGQNLFRSQPIDCPVGTTSTRCPGTTTAGTGGYTYGDFGKIIGRPQTHADGEIWGQTLWDLRRSLGVSLTRSLVTRAMELSPANPSFLDMRNAILQADKVVNKGKAATKIWKVFATRGMGWFAGAVDGDDVAPVQSFALPPAKGTATGSLTGRITDDSTGAGVSGVTVRFGGHASGFPGDYAATTGTDGRYTIRGILVGTYPSVAAGGAGYDRQLSTATVKAGKTTLNWVLRRNWALVAGGSTIGATNATDYELFGCGPAALVDGSIGSGLSTDRVGGTGTTPVTPKYVTLVLPTAVNISEVAVDPSATCGDGGSAATGPYRVETSTDGVTFTAAASGTFTPADRGRFTSVPLAAGSGTGVRYVRYTMLDSQAVQLTTCPAELSGCSYVDTTELSVYGTAAG